MVKVLQVRGRPSTFSGKIRLPPSKSYLHRALFVAGLTSGKSSIFECGTQFNDDIAATIDCIGHLGVRIATSKENHGTLNVSRTSKSIGGTISINASASGTTARFLIPFSALTEEGAVVQINGDQSLSKRPMGTVSESLKQLGVSCKSLNSDGKLPIIVEGGGIRGGECELDGSISSQFVSSLLISCTRADNDTTIYIKHPEKQVSKPYILATLKVLEWFGFKVESHESGNHAFDYFKVKGNQVVRGRRGFPVPGDMSSGASLICAAISSRGEISLSNLGDQQFPQPDSQIIEIAEEFGGQIKRRGKTLRVKPARKISRGVISLDLEDSPDLVPVMAGLAAGTDTKLKIKNVGHLRFKESDRLSTLAKQLGQMGVVTSEGETSLEINGMTPSSSKTLRKPILLDPENDHRMLIAFTIAGLSGKFGKIAIRDPDCVKKSYPNFVPDLQRLCHEKTTVALVEYDLKE